VEDYKAWYENGKELTARRKALSWSAAELARQSGVSRSIVANVESGRTALKGDLASKLWTTIALADVKRREEDSQFRGYSHAIARDAAVDEADPAVASLFPNLLALRSFDPNKQPTTQNIAEFSGELTAFRQHLDSSVSIICEQMLLRISYEKRLQEQDEEIKNLRAEVSAWRDQLGTDIKRLESELRSKQELAAQQGGAILSENEIAAATPDRERIKG